jgi:hypothetical protein
MTPDEIYEAEQLELSKRMTLNLRATMKIMLK